MILSFVIFSVEGGGLNLKNNVYVTRLRNGEGRNLHHRETCQKFISDTLKGHLDGALFRATEPI